MEINSLIVWLIAVIFFVSGLAFGLFLTLLSDAADSYNERYLRGDLGDETDE